MSDFTAEVNLNVRCCYVCGTHFAMTDDYEKFRREDGVVFHCPNGHQLSWNGYAPRSELQEQLDAVNEEMKTLKSHNVGLLSKLDQAEAQLIEYGLLEIVETPLPPPPPPPLLSRDINEPSGGDE